MLVAMAVLSISVLTLAGLLIANLQLSSQNRESVAAAQAAQSMLEQIRAGEVALPSSARTFQGALNEPRQDGFPPSPYPQIQANQTTILYDVQIEPVAGRNGLFWIKIRAHWGVQHGLELESYVFRP